MVEHNLAKVGVASSSLVFRSCKEDNAQVAELVDAHVSGACVERRAGSTPVLGTKSSCGEQHHQCSSPHTFLIPNSLTGTW